MRGMTGAHGCRQAQLGKAWSGEALIFACAVHYRPCVRRGGYREPQARWATAGPGAGAGDGGSKDWRGGRHGGLGCRRWCIGVCEMLHLRLFERVRVHAVLQSGRRTSSSPSNRVRCVQQLCEATASCGAGRPSVSCSTGRGDVKKKRGGAWRSEVARQATRAQQCGWLPSAE